MRRLIEPMLLIAVPAVLILCAVFSAPAAGLTSALVAVAALLPFIFGYEKRRPRPRDIMPIVVFAAIAVAGRIVLSPLPGVQPASALIIVCGIYFGRQSGFLTGVLVALVSNMVLGQGVWTPWQMYCWGAMGYIAGALFSGGRRSPEERVKCAAVYIYGAASSFLFGAIMDSWYAVSFIETVTPASLMLAYAAGLPFNLAHAASTVAFLALALVPWGKKIARIKRKYGLAG